MSTITPCRCKREPEVNTSLQGYAHSLSCKCGTDKINFLARSDSSGVVIDNWNSLVLRKPFFHSVQYLPDPDAHVVLPFTDFDNSARHRGNPLAQWFEAHGGHCGGSRGGCS
jgi:hypothetical protein